MKYKNIVSGEFVSRINRFTANVNICGTIETVHVKNTGRCKELLVPGCTVWLSVSDNPARKTKYDLVTVEKKRENGCPLLVNVDSMIVNDVVAEWLPGSGIFGNGAVIKREIFYGNSRFDFMIEDNGNKTYLEVKGVTLEHDGIARFPDAPTERGVKHIGELMNCIKNGYNAFIVFVIQMKDVDSFSPNDPMHPEFGKILRRAYEEGVKILAMDCKVENNSIVIDRKVPIVL